MRADFEKGTKICGRCGRELPVSEFGKDKSKNDGLRYYCKKCVAEYNKEYYKTEEGKKVIKRSGDKNRNTFGRVGNKRGNGGIVKRDYELTEQQLERRNKSRRSGKHKTKRINPQGLLVWYDGKLDDITSEEYIKIMMREYMIQRICAIRGYIARKQPSEHFLFDFDLEQMLKDNVYYKSGKHKKYIEKWWDGTIRHWTVNDGVWKDKGGKNNVFCIFRVRT